MARPDDEVPPLSFHMLGIIHRDRRNVELLEKWIDALTPGVITLELSPYGLAFRQAMGEVYRKRIDDIVRSLRSEGCLFPPGDLDDLYSYVDVPAEFAIADEYCRRSGARLYPVDMDFFSRMRLQGIDELISRENMEKSAAFRAPEGRGTESVLASLYFRSGVTAFSYTDEMALRDGYMCRGIEVLARRFSGKSFLHIAGWRHLMDPLGLYARFHPVKIFPYD
jgi:hypothetical protein